MPRLSHRAGRPIILDRARSSCTRRSPAIFVRWPAGIAGDRGIKDWYRFYAPTTHIGNTRHPGTPHRGISQSPRVRRYRVWLARGLYFSVAILSLQQER